jgi:peptidoglycan/LPS O-acetylase OafA/YrhL
LEFSIYFLLSFTVSVITISLQDALIAFCVVLLIDLFSNYTNKVTDFLGKISYSLYLIHIPVGHKMTYELLKFADSSPLLQFLIIIFGILFSIGASYLFYLLIERPSENLAKKIKPDLN